MEETTENKKFYIWINVKERNPHSFHPCLPVRFVHTQLLLADPKRWIELHPNEVDLLEWLEEQTDKVIISKERYEALMNCVQQLHKIISAPNPYNSHEAFSFVDTAR